MFLKEYRPRPIVARYVRRYSRKYPIIFPAIYHTCVWIYPIFEIVSGRLKDWFYYPVHYFFRRYDLARTKLSRFSYHDPDTVMFNACFELLSEFVLSDVSAKNHKDAIETIEKYFNSVTNDPNDKNLRLWELYRWWQIEYPNRVEIFSNDQEKEVYTFLYGFYEKQDQAMFMKLAALRQYLWN